MKRKLIESLNNQIDILIMEKYQKHNQLNPNQMLDQLFEQLVRVRRHLHQIPEIGLQQYKTSAFIRQYITKNIPSAQLAQVLEGCPTAVIAKFTHTNPKMRFLYRCDIDALPIRQQSGLQYASKQECSHMCGHDGHITAMLIAMRVLEKNRDKIDYEITFVFQPGQQGKRGAYTLFKQCPNLVQRIDCCFALHMDNRLEPGFITIYRRYATSNSKGFTIQIKGKDCHSMIPQFGVDANYIGCSLVTHLYGLKNRILGPLQQGCLAVTQIKGGNGFGVSANFSINGSLRSVTLESHNKMETEIQRMSNQFCKAFGAEANVQFKPSCYRTVQNKQPAISLMKNAISRFTPQEKILTGQPSLAGQDFCQFSEKRPSCYITIGCAQVDSTQNGQSKFLIHSSKFRLDERGILTAARTWVWLSLKPEQ